MVEFNLKEKRKEALLKIKEIYETSDKKEDWDNIFEGVFEVIKEQDKELLGKIKCSWSGLRSRTPEMQKVIDVFVKNINKLSGEFK